MRLKTKKRHSMTDIAHCLQVTPAERIQISADISIRIAFVHASEK